jgi:hypothetical protein
MFQEFYMKSFLLSLFLSVGVVSPAFSDSQEPQDLLTESAPPSVIPFGVFLQYDYKEAWQTPVTEDILGIINLSTNELSNGMVLSNIYYNYNSKRRSFSRMWAVVESYEKISNTSGIVVFREVFGLNQGQNPGRTLRVFVDVQPRSIKTTILGQTGDTSTILDFDRPSGSGSGEGQVLPPEGGGFPNPTGCRNGCGA